MTRWMTVLVLGGVGGCYAGPEIADGSLSGSYLLVDEDTETPVEGIEGVDQDGNVVGQSDEDGRLDVTIDGEWLEGLELDMFTLRDPQGRYAGQTVFVTSASKDLQSRVTLVSCTPQLCPAP